MKRNNPSASNAPVTWRGPKRGQKGCGNVLSSSKMLFELVITYVK